MNELKYEFTGETTTLFNGTVLHRIRALKDFSEICKGDLGGWIESEKNLSQNGNAWVYDNARVYGNAEVSGNAWVSGDAGVYGNAKVYDNARVYGNAEVYGNAWVSGDAGVYGNAKVYNNAEVSGNAEVYDNAEVSDNAEIYGDAEVSGNAEIKKITDVLTISPIGSRNDITTFYKARNNKIFAKCGCKNTDIDTWLKMVEATHGNNKHGQAYKLAAQIARLQIELTEEKTDE